MNAEELLNAGTVASADIGHLYSFILTADDEPGVLAATFLPNSGPPADAFIGRQCGLVGTRVNWTPGDPLPSKPVWALVAVARGQAAVAGVGPYDGQWYRIQPLDFPWFIASSAGGIRDSIENGKPLTFMEAHTGALLGKVSETDAPVNEDGILDETGKVSRIVSTRVVEGEHPPVRGCVTRPCMYDDSHYCWVAPASQPNLATAEGVICIECMMIELKGR